MRVPVQTPRGAVSLVLAAAVFLAGPGAPAHQPAFRGAVDLTSVDVQVDDSARNPTAGTGPAPLNCRPARPGQSAVAVVELLLQVADAVERAAEYPTVGDGGEPLAGQIKLAQ